MRNQVLHLIGPVLDGYLVPEAPGRAPVSRVVITTMDNCAWGKILYYIPILPSDKILTNRVRSELGYQYV